MSSRFQPLHTTACHSSSAMADGAELRPRRAPRAAGQRRADRRRSSWRWSSPASSSAGSSSGGDGGSRSVVGMAAHLLRAACSVTVAASSFSGGVVEAGAGRSRSTGTSASTRPGRLDSTTTRSARRTASRTSWVTNRHGEAALAPQPLELVVQHVARDGVERAERLVHQQHLGVLGQRPGQRGALAHAARQLVRAACPRSRSGAPTASSSRARRLAVGRGARRRAAARSRRCGRSSATGTAPTPGT